MKLEKNDEQAIAEPSSPATRSWEIIEIIALTLLALATLCGIAGSILNFIPDSETGALDLAMLPACIGGVVAGVSSMGLIWFRKRGRPMTVSYTLGILTWFLGVVFFGSGGFMMLLPDENPFIADLSISLVFCFGPGGLLALLGLGLYIYDYRQQKKLSDLNSSPSPVPSSVHRADKLRRAREYRTRITQFLKQDSSLSPQFADIPTHLEAWELRIHQLIKRLDTFETDPILQRDLELVPQSIEHLQAELETEIDPQIRAQMLETLKDYKSQLQQLESLSSLIRRTDLKIDETLAEIGSIYSQIQLFGAKKIDSHRIQRLSANIDEEAKRLNDLLSAMDDVYHPPARTN